VLLLGTFVSLAVAAAIFGTRGKPLRPKAGMRWHITGYEEAADRTSARNMLSASTQTMGGNAMSTLDKNHDNVASLSEVESFAKEKGLDYAATLAEFAGFDQDKDGNLNKDELGQALSDGTAELPTPPEFLCGVLPCAANSVCCHGLCGTPDSFCCGKILCDSDSICCPGLLDGITICCGLGMQCCGGICVANNTCLADVNATR
jgi:hypothetical protein